MTLAGREVCVPGLVLEAAFALGESDPVQGWLLFLTHDRPFEESLSISLLSATGALLDCARIEAAYAAAIFSDLQAMAKGRVRFTFLGDQAWELSLLGAPERCLPFLSDPRHVRRANRFSRHFRLSRA